MNEVEGVTFFYTCHGNGVKKSNAPFSQHESQHTTIDGE